MLSKKELRTKLEEVQEENKRLKLESKESFNNIKTFVLKVSHEMKTPLNSIIGFGELFKYKTGDEKLKSYIDNILKSSRYMLSLIQNMIDVAYSQNNKFELSYSIFNPKDAIEDIISEFCSKNISYTLINITICADYLRFKQVIYNLISNALKYSYNRKPIELISYIENGLFCVEVIDYGEEIKEKDYEKIFEFFTQVSNDATKRQLGLGIGLSLCKTIADAHNGEICVSSKSGEKTSFVFKIPIDLNEN